MENLFLIVLFLMAVFLILLVLVQRGRGGGLAGAFGGAGGSSAFGAKAGDTFTKITVWAASIWIVTCVAASYWASHKGDSLGSAPSTASSTIDFSGVGAAEGDSADAAEGGEAASDDAPAEPAAETPAEGE